MTTTKHPAPPTPPGTKNADATTGAAPLQRAKDTASAAFEELQTAFRAHADLARQQYDEFKTRHGDPLVPVEKARVNAAKLTKELEQSARDLAQKVRAWAPLSGDEETTMHSSSKGAADGKAKAKADGPAKQ